MITGFLFFFAGILIAVYPQLLSLIVASFLMVVGLFIILASIYYKRLSRNSENPFIDFIFRF